MLGVALGKYYLSYQKLEGINNKLKFTKKRSYGLRKFWSFELQSILVLHFTN
ncbi:MAG: transposase [cyanobacterium endosymbiont of Rhopalodia yunnanensis]